MNDLLALFRSFVRVVEAGSFTAVAADLGSSQPTVSRQIAALEAHLGCQLFHRSTRALTLTDDGSVLYGHATAALDAASIAERSVGRLRGRPSGVLRLSCAVVLGRLHILPRLAELMAQYPDLTLDLRLNDAFADLVEEGIDLAIRVGDVTEPGLVARRIGTTRRVVAATPGYLARAGIPRSPADLAAHDCIVYDRLASGANWSFISPAGPLSVPVRGRLHVNSTEAVREAILCGLGIGYVPTWHFVDGEFASGKLVPLLEAWQPKPQPISGVYPSRRHLAPKVRVALDFFAAAFAADPQLRIAA